MAVGQHALQGGGRGAMRTEVKHDLHGTVSVRPRHGTARQDAPDRGEDRVKTRKATLSHGPKRLRFRRARTYILWERRTDATDFSCPCDHP